VVSRTQDLHVHAHRAAKTRAGHRFGYQGSHTFRIESGWRRSTQARRSPSAIRQRSETAEGAKFVKAVDKLPRRK
jgi:hypothetical protein